jgi:cytochrome c
MVAMPNPSVGACIFMAAAVISAAAATPPEALPGARIWQARCSGCHSLDANKVGPLHRGVYGRHAGQAPGYAYSPALKAADVVWTDTTLDQWLQGPQQMVKGTRMVLVVPRAEDRAAIIAYLKAQSGQ